MQSQLEALAAELVRDNGDPPDTDYQRGYMAACEEIAGRLAVLADVQQPCLGGALLDRRIEALDSVMAPNGEDSGPSLWNNPHPVEAERR